MKRNTLSFVLILISLIQMSRSATIVCGEAENLMSVGVASNFTCTNINRNPSITPILPTGVSYSNGRISGTPTVPSPLTTYTITSQQNSGTFVLGVIGMPTKLTAGVSSQVIFSGLSMIPIKFLGDTVFTQYSINPQLTNGLSLVNGTISGVYTGGVTSVSYQVTGTNSFGSITSVLTLQYKATSDANSPGLTACYYNTYLRYVIPSESWYYENPATTCALVESLDLSDNYGSQQEHSWPGLDDRFQNSFHAVITGYINIGASADYVFTLTATDIAKLYFDTNTATTVETTWQVHTVNGTINLTSGRHLMRLYYASGTGANELKLRYSSVAAGLPMTVVSNTVTFLGGRAPSFLEERDINNFIGGTIASYRPMVCGSHVTEYSTIPALPSGLTINSVSGIITGSSSVSINGDYTIRATGVLGYSESKIHITIGGSPIGGIEAKYYALQNSQWLCTMQSFTSEMLTLKVHTVDTIINHPELASGSAWNGIPGDVFGRFYVSWNGYLNIPTSGDYSFKLANRDGARITINDNTLINNWGCLDAMTEKEGTITFNNGGYVPFSVEFFSNNNDFGVVLSWKKPTDSEYVMIPESAFGHIPESSFTYTSTKTHYYRYVNIIGNTPVFFGVNIGTPTYSVAPDLPSGLQLQTSGMITGSPNDNSEETTYTITATSSTMTLLTTISIEVTYVAPPDNLQITDSQGQAVTSATLNQFQEMSPISLSADNNPRNWQFSPDLPNGLSYSSRNRRIQGTPRESSAQRAYTITAVNSGGSVSRSLYLTVSGCQYGKFLYSVLNDGAGGSLTVKKGNDTIYSNDVKSGSYSVTLCIPQDTYTYSFTCGNGNECYFQLVREDGVRFLFTRTQRGRTDNGDLKTLVTEKPTLEASETSLIVAARQRFSVSLTPRGIYRPLAIKPALPSTMGLDTNWNTISGYIGVQGVYKYTVTCENEVGQATVVIEVNVGTCPDNKNLITLSRSFGRREESMKITYDATGEVIVEEQFAESAYTKTLCMKNGDYTVVMKTTRSGGSWTVGQELLIKDSWEDLLASAILDNGEGEQTSYFGIQYTILDRLPMKYLNSGRAADKNWNTVNFDDSKWDSKTYNTFGNYTGNTVYFRNKFTVDNKNKYPIFAFDLEMYDGIVAYINGKEVIRRNLPEGTITSDTLSTSRYDSLIWRRSSVPTSALQNGINVLAIEMHLYQESIPAMTIVNFDMYASLLSGSCMLRTDRGTASDSQHSPDPRYPASSAFDQNAQSMWRDRNLPVFVQYTYNYDRYEYINKVILRSGRDYTSNHPKKFNILGMKSSNDGDILASIDDRNFFSGSYSTNPVYLTNTKSYNAYRLEIEETNSDSNTATIGEVLLYTCNIVYCTKEKGWESIMTGEMSYGSCPRNTFGESTRQCNLNAYNPVWANIDYSTCLSTRPSSGVAYIDFKYMVSNCTMTNFNYFVNSRFIDIVRNILLAKKENINIYLKRDCSDSETKNVCFNVRVTIDNQIADYVYAQTSTLQEEMSYLMYDNPPMGFPQGMFFVMTINPLLRKPTSALTIALIVVGCLIIIGAVIAVIYRNKTIKQSKRVRGGSVAHKATLESIQEKMERNKKEKKGLMDGDDE